MRSSSDGNTSYEDIKNRIKQRLEYVSEDIPNMMRDLVEGVSSKMKRPDWIGKTRVKYDVLVVGNVFLFFFEVLKSFTFTQIFNNLHIHIQTHISAMNATFTLTYTFIVVL